MRECEDCEASPAPATSHSSPRRSEYKQRYVCLALQTAHFNLRINGVFIQFNTFNTRSP